MKNNTKNIINDIFSNDVVRLKEDVKQNIHFKLKNILEAKKLQLTAEMFDSGNMSTKSLRESVISQRSKARHNVLLALREAVHCERTKPFKKVKKEMVTDAKFNN